MDRIHLNPFDHTIPRLAPSIIRWYKAEANTEHLASFLQETLRTVEQTLHCLDLFGASQKVKSTWIDHGYASESFDIKISDSHDVCSLSGVQHLLTLGSRMPSYEIDSNYFLPNSRSKILYVG